MSENIINNPYLDPGAEPIYSLRSTSQTMGNLILKNELTLELE